SALRGSVDLTSVAGGGTTFSIRLPLTLAILAGLAVEAGGERFVVPLQAVEECLAVPPEASRSRTATSIIDVDGIPVPSIRLGPFYGLPTPRAGRENVVMVRSGERCIGLIADRLFGEV